MISAGFSAETDEGTILVSEGMVITSANNTTVIIARMDFPDIARLLMGYRSEAWGPPDASLKTSGFEDARLGF